MNSLIGRLPLAAIQACALTFTSLFMLSACGGGSGGDSVRSHFPEVPTDEIAMPADPQRANVLDKYRRHLNDGDSSDTWPVIGDYTHSLTYLLGDGTGDSVVDGLFPISATNFACQEETCWTSEEAANSLGEVMGVDHVMDHADLPIYRFNGENSLSGLAPFSYDTYGVWLEYTAFSVARTCDIGADCEQHNAFEYSVPSVGGRPSGSSPKGVGTASWVGVVIAADMETHNLVLGDAKLTIDDLAASVLVDIALTGLWDVDIGIARADIRWDDLPIGGGGPSVSVPGVDVFPPGAFGRGYAEFGLPGIAEGDYVIGQFFGDAHQEVAGIFMHQATRTSGTFGGKRQ